MENGKGECAKETTNTLVFFIKQFCIDNLQFLMQFDEKLSILAKHDFKVMQMTMNKTLYLVT